MKRNLPSLFTFAGATGLLLAWAGATTWGREDAAALHGGVARLYEAATPLPGPIYRWEAVVFALVGALAVTAGWRLLAGAARGGRLALDLVRGRRALGESGQAMTEVAVTFPILLITTLGLMQLALLYQAKNVVTYAAFAATRAAVVWIPAEADGEGVHQLNVDGGDKMDKIHQAAWMACIPISPRASVILASVPFLGDLVGSIAGGLSSALSGLGVAGEVVANLVERAPYSMFATEVTIYKASDAGFEEVSGTASWDWPNEADVAVQVDHRYYLPIPVVNRIFGGTWSLIDLGPIFSLDVPGRFSMIHSRAFLPLEGKTGDPPISGFWDF